MGRILTVKLKVGKFSGSFVVLLFIDSPSSRSVEIDPNAMILNFLSLPMRISSNLWAYSPEKYTCNTVLHIIEEHSVRFPKA